MTVPVIAVNPAYNVFLNNMAKTVLLSQLVYWDGRKCLQRWGETWFVKTSADLAEEICHGSAKSVGDWLREFKEMGVIKVKRGFFKGINQLWIQVNQERIRALLGEFDIQAEVPAESESNLPETELTTESNLPQTELSQPVTSPTGNCISKITSTKIIDQIQTDDDDFLFSTLTQEQIDIVTERVMLQVNTRQLTASPIRNVRRYLHVALENEVERVRAIKPKKRDVRGNDDKHSWEAYFPQNDETWDGRLFWDDPTRAKSG